MQNSGGPYRPPPRNAGQDIGPLMRRLPRHPRSNVLMPAVRLDMLTVRDGWLVIGDGVDGLILNREQRIVRQPAKFSVPDRTGAGVTELDLPLSDTRFDQVFIGVDADWTNWFHWLCFALFRSAFAAELLRDDCPIVLPDYPAVDASPRLRFSHAAWGQSLAAAGLLGRATFLPPGIYKAGVIRFLWTQPNEPTSLTLLPAFHGVFARMRRGLRYRPELPRRLLVSRTTATDPRIAVQEWETLIKLASAHGFQPITFEALDFRTQAEAMFNADAVIGVHGAGLTNIMFGRRDLRVMELNLPLDGSELLRPWFYLLAHARRQPYGFLNQAAGDLNQERLAAAIDSLVHGLSR
ncbi:MAG TPA: glycosyltransferase family 61 protein [Acetobacteraceae bacterium]|jgi:hypothetical protein